MPKYAVLFVCMGNICRSPTAHAVFRARLRQAGLDQLVRVDSAGTHGYHGGRPPDERAQAHALRRGYDLSDLRAQPLRDDQMRVDLVLVMDAQNLQTVRGRYPDAPPEQLRLLTDFCRHHASTEVPDPYYGGAQGFAQVLDLIEDACDGLLAHVRTALGQEQRDG